MRMHTVTQSYGLSPIFPSLPFPSSFSLSLSLLLFRASSPLFFFPLLSSFSLSLSLPFHCTIVSLSFLVSSNVSKYLHLCILRRRTYFYIHGLAKRETSFFVQRHYLPSFRSCLFSLLHSSNTAYRMNIEISNEITSICFKNRK